MPNIRSTRWTETPRPSYSWTGQRDSASSWKYQCIDQGIRV